MVDYPVAALFTYPEVWKRLFLFGALEKEHLPLAVEDHRSAGQHVILLRVPPEEFLVGDHVLLQ